MRASDQGETFAVLPDPGQARTLDDLVGRLRALKNWAGNPSYETIKNRINAAWADAGRPAAELAKKTTVVDCFRTGRRRLNVDLVIAVVAALHPDPGYGAQWRQALRVVVTESQASAQVRGQDTLPADLAEFTGRSAELDRLRRLLRRRGGSGSSGGGSGSSGGGSGSSGGAVVISAIEGMAGVGKTRLAVHAGHVLAREEPFEQVLFVNLRGFHPDPTQPPADPGAVLDSFLRLLGVSGQHIPHELSARTALYRKRLAGTRALVVLDNAADEAQVEPLLPGSPDCVTLVTSRRRLAGLRPATHLSVDVFTPDEARAFLARAAPDVPVGNDPDAAARVASRCGYLPLALGLVAGHMRARPGWTLTDHADRLDERHRDRKLDDGVELALSLSYQHLPPERRRLFRLLALHPGHDVDAYAAAALSDVDLDVVSDDLHRLAADHLVQRSTPGRFVFHDLVRAYAAGRAVDADSPRARRAALTRLFDHYLHTAAATMDTLRPAERDRRPRIGPPATPAPPVADPTAAREWLDTERVNLIATAAHTAAHGWPSHTTRLAATLFRYLDNGGHNNDAITIHTHARHASRHAGDRAAEADTLNNLGAGYWGQGRFAEAADHFEQALILFRTIGDRLGEARALANIGSVYRQQSRYPQAVDHFEQARTLFRTIGDRLGEARALVNLGIVHRRLGHYPHATEHYQSALTVLRDIGDRPGQALALQSFSRVYERQGRYRQAADRLQQALTMFRELGNRSGEGNTLTDLGVVYYRVGHYRQAAHHHRQALTLFRDLGSPSGEAEALNGLGETLFADGQPDQARAQHTAALTVATEVGDRDEQARAHNGLAHIHHTAGAIDQARHHWREALAIYSESGVPEAEQVRAHLADLDNRRLPGQGSTQVSRGKDVDRAQRNRGALDSSLTARWPVSS